MSCQTSNTNTKIVLPFPPTIRVSNIVNSYKLSSFKSKGPNAFFVYREAFLDQFNRQNHNPKMINVSKLVNNYWKNEPENVKNEYRRIAQKVEIKLNRNHKKTVPNKKIRNYSIRKRNRNQCNSVPDVLPKDLNSQNTELNYSQEPNNNYDNLNFEFNFDVNQLYPLYYLQPEGNAVNQLYPPLYNFVDDYLFTKFIF
ncbi:hypothetical protein GLOIN_2v1580099 [Rhizophagus clarus]|nr:hypothetical protein GLOIN_2v1580099 [Rhizophagus clarus]